MVDGNAEDAEEELDDGVDEELDPATGSGSSSAAGVTGSSPPLLRLL